MKIIISFVIGFILGAIAMFLVPGLVMASAGH